MSKHTERLLMLILLFLCGVLAGANFITQLL